jgi:hypothetical protein
LLQRVELGFIHRRLDREGPANIHAEKADIDARYLLADQHHGLRRQRELFVELADLPAKEAECER